MRGWRGSAAAACGPDRDRARAAALAEPADRIAARHLAMLRLDQLGYLRSHAPGGWRADLTLDGLEHLHGALAAGRGAILWVAPTVFAPLLAKRALHERAFPCTI